MKLIKLNSKVLVEMTTLKEDVRQLERSNDQYEGMLKDIRQHIIGSPTEKRKQEV